MNNNAIYKFLIYPLSLFCLAIPAFAQDQKKDAEKPSLAEEIEVIRPYKPILAEAVKIRRSPDLSDNKTFKPVLTYTILDKKLELNSNIKELQAQKLAAEQAPQLLNNYVKIGAGNLNSGLGEVYLNTGRDEALQAGLFIKHLAQQGSINRQQFSEQTISGFGRSIGTDKTYSGAIGYNRRSTFFYGFNPDLPVAAGDPLRQRFNLLEAEGELLSSYSEAEDLPNYAIKLNAYLLSNNSNSRENNFALQGHVNFPLGNFQIGVGASADYTGAKDSLFDIRNNILRGNPFLKYQGEGFFLNLGLNVVHEFGAQTRTNLLPAVTAEASIAADYAVLFAGLTGDVLKTSIKGLTDENIYLGKDYMIRNALEKVNIYGGIKGNAGAGFGYKAKAFYKRIEDLPLFVNDPFRVSRFNVIYDEGVSKVVGFEGEVNFKASDIVDISGKAEALSFSTATEQEAWFKPGLRLSSNLRAKINQKLSIDAEFFLNGESRARMVNITPIPEPQESIVTIKSFADLSAGAQYQINDKIGVYLQANNIFGKPYQQYLYYQKLGLNILGGFNYSF